MTNCKHAKQDIALWVGSDLDEPAVHRMERHLAQCPPCREYADSMKAALRMLHEPADQPDFSRASLWPALCARIDSLENRAQLGRFNGWLPALTVVAASIALILLLDMQPAAQPRAITPMFPTVPVVSQPGEFRNAPQRFPSQYIFEAPEQSASPEFLLLHPVGGNTLSDTGTLGPSRVTFP